MARAPSTSRMLAASRFARSTSPPPPSPRWSGSRARAEFCSVPSPVAWDRRRGWRLAPVASCSSPTKPRLPSCARGSDLTFAAHPGNPTGCGRGIGSTFLVTGPPWAFSFRNPSFQRMAPCLSNLARSLRLIAD